MGLPPYCLIQYLYFFSVKIYCKFFKSTYWIFFWIELSFALRLIDYGDTPTYIHAEKADYVFDGTSCVCHGSFYRRMYRYGK